MEKLKYKVIRDGIEWIAGRRIDDDGTIMLTEREAEHDLARRIIELVEMAVEPDAPLALPTPETGADDAAKGRKGR